MGSDDAPTVLFVMSHPHDVHLFRNVIDELSGDGFRLHVVVRDKEITADLLERYGIAHDVLASDNATKADLVRSWSRFGYNLLREVRRIRPDLVVAEVGAVTSPVSWLLDTNSLVFMDAEHATLQNSLVYPFATRICTSTCFWKEIGPKQVRYEGYQELAYLHPDRFEPDPSVLDEAGLDEDETFVLLRQVGWNAAHDVNAGGFAGVEAVIEELESTGATVVVTSEEPLPDHLASYQPSVEPHRIHDLMYYADLYVGESATMATESAVLGTPAVYVSTIEVGYASEIAEEYGLLFQYSGPDRQSRGIVRAKEILDSGGEDWRGRWERLVSEKRDTTNVILEQIRDMTDRPKAKSRAKSEVIE